MIEMLALTVIFLFAIRRFTARSCWLAIPHDETRLGMLGDPQHFDTPTKSCFAGYGCADDCPVNNESNRAQLNMLAREIREDWRR